jgi:hypothetical protein
VKKFFFLLFFLFCFIPHFVHAEYIEGQTTIYEIGGIEPGLISVLCATDDCSYFHPSTLTVQPFDHSSGCTSYITRKYSQSSSNTAYSWSVSSSDFLSYDSTTRVLRTSDLDFLWVAAVFSDPSARNCQTDYPYHYLTPSDPASESLYEEYADGTIWGYVMEKASSLGVNELYSFSYSITDNIDIIDSDGDTFPDHSELGQGSDPQNPISTPDNPHATQSDPNCLPGYSDNGQGVCEWDVFYCESKGSPSNYVLYKDGVCRLPSSDTPVDGGPTPVTTDLVEDNDPDNDGNPGTTGGTDPGDDYDGDGVANVADPNPYKAVPGDADATGEESGVSDARSVLNTLESGDSDLLSLQDDVSQYDFNQIVNSSVPDTPSFSGLQCPIVDRVFLLPWANTSGRELVIPLGEYLCPVLDLSRVLLFIAAYFVGFNYFLRIGLGV